MIRHMRHGSPPRLMALQSILSPNRRESLPTPSAGVRMSLRSVQRIWDAHGLAPHRIRTFKLSRDPLLSERLKDVVGLYVDPPAHAVVLSVDEKSQIQALEHTQPGLPLKAGRIATMT